MSAIIYGYLAKIEAGKFDFSVSLEDIHMNIESRLSAKIGEAGKRLHTGRSRNDQVALDIRLYLRDEIVEVSAYLDLLIDSLISQAEGNLDVIMPGYTHLQRAQNLITIPIYRDEQRQPEPFGYVSPGSILLRRSASPGMKSDRADILHRLRIRGDAPRNNLEVKFADASGDNVWKKPRFA